MRNDRILLSKKRQGGWSMTQLLFWGLLGGSVIYTGFRMAPAYHENLLVVEALKDYAEKYPTELEGAKKSHVSRKLDAFFTLNGVRGVNGKIVEVDNQKGRSLINFNYEVRVELFGNVDVVMKFANQLDSKNPEECCEPLVEYNKKQLKNSIEVPDRAKQLGL